MSLHDHALYQIATKALIFDEDKILILITPDGYIDFPGGRVDQSERDIPWVNALKREIKEELGNSFVVEIGQTLFVSKRRYDKNNLTHHIAAIFYECRYQDGAIQLSDEHGSYEWSTLRDLVNDDRRFVSEDEKQHLNNLLVKKLDKGSAVHPIALAK